MSTVFSSCEHVVDDNTGCTVVVIAVAPVVSAARGPANRDRQARFDYFVTVVGPDDTILNKEAFGLAVQFPGNRTRVRFRDDDPPVTVDLPLSGGGSVLDYRLFVGFQLTPDELSYNRRRDAIGAIPEPALPVLISEGERINWRHRRIAPTTEHRYPEIRSTLRERPARAGAERATAPETLRQKDRTRDETLESRHRGLAPGASPKKQPAEEQTRGIFQVPRQRGRPAGHGT